MSDSEGLNLVKTPPFAFQLSVGVFSMRSITIVSKGALRVWSLRPSFCTARKSAGLGVSAPSFARGSPGIAPLRPSGTASASIATTTKSSLPRRGQSVCAHHVLHHRDQHFHRQV